MWSQSFSRLTGRDVYLKAECMQRAGSFKIRGALNVLTRLDGQPVVAASAGNHAQGVALAAAFSGSKCTVFMPEGAAIPKIKATQDYGAEVELAGSSLADAVELATAYAAETGARLVHPYDDPLIIAGQGTMGLEILEQLPEVGTVVVPTGGGGLLAGTAIGVRSLKPEVKVLGVEIEAAAVYAASRRKGEVIRDFPRGTPTVADGIAVSVPSDLVWEIAEEHVDEFLVVNDAQTTAALTLILERSKLMVEAAGAVGVAALMEKLIPDDAPDPICIVLSGGQHRPDVPRQGGAPRPRSLGSIRQVQGPGAGPAGQPLPDTWGDRRERRQPGPRRASSGGLPAPIRHGRDRALGRDQDADHAARIATALESATS